MKTDSSTLYMIQFRLRMDAIFAIADRRTFRDQDPDLGYLVHCWLGEAFAGQGPKPFSIQLRKAGFIDVLGYAERSYAELRELAESKARADINGACYWSESGGKPMPDELPRGKRFSFEARVCPTVRVSRQTAHQNRGAEVDAFLARCREPAFADRPVDRGAVYHDWMAAQFGRDGAASLLHAEMVAFRRARLLRRSKGDTRTGRICERPDATFRGIIEVGEPLAFSRLLTRGLGRHRTFGFGMILLRRSSEQC